VLVSASYSANLSNQAPVTVALYRDGSDGGVLLAQATESPGGNPPFGVAVTLHFLDTLPDGASHYYTVSAAGTGTALTCPVDNVVVTAVEL
jgi:hypothetical protein